MSNKDDKENFVKELLVALEKEEIIYAIKNIFKKENIDKDVNGKQFDIEIINKKLKEQTELTSMYVDKAKELQTLSDELKRQLTSEKNKAESIQKELKETFLYLEEIKVHNKKLEEKLAYSNVIIEDYKSRYKIYDRLNALSENTLMDVSRIFKGKNYEEFIACGAQIDSINSLWDYTKNKILLNKEFDVEVLTDIIQYFISLYNKTSDTPTFIIQEVNIGDEFDADLYIRTSDSRASGRILEVCLIGYANKNTGKIIKKSIVRVG